jgi:non-specific serine/threonine protein kinase
MDPTRALTFGELLRQQRIATGLTQETLAERTGLGVRSIQHLEGGAHLPHRETIDRLIRGLRLSGEERSRFERVAQPIPRRRETAAVSPGTTTDGDARSRPPRHDLTAPLTSFIGREREVAEVQRLLLRTDVRLVTLIGTGGVGKTRLSLAVTQRVLEAFPDRVVFVPLSVVREPGVVALAIAQALGVHDFGGRPASEALREFLREGALLLVLDNLEQIEDAPLLIADLLMACPRLKVLATSRRALQVSGEHEYQVPPLDVPDVAHLPTASALAHNDSVQLFLERSRAMRPELMLGDENLRAIAEICVRLDGLPLAIELAAARVRLLPPMALRDRLAGSRPSPRLRLLTDGAKDLPPRQQTLRSTIAWSHDLLTEGERRLFRRLAVFVGSFGIAAVEAVGVALEDDADRILGALESLVRDGLLVQSGGSGREPRLALLETIREFALERLDESGERDAVERAHAEYYAALFEEAAPWLRTGEQLAWLERLDPEQANLRAALGWATTGDVRLGLRFVAAAWDYWELRSLTFDVIGAARRLIDRSDTPEHADAPERLWAMATMVSRASWPTSLPGERWALAEDCLARCRVVGDRRGTAYALLAVADRLVYADPGRALPLLEEGLVLARELGESWLAGRVLGHLGRAAWFLGDRARARAALTESLALYRRAGDRSYIAIALLWLGEVARAAGAYAEAEAYLTDGLTVHRSLGSHVWAGDLLLASLAHLAYDQGDVAGAHARLDDAIARARERGKRVELANELNFLRNVARLVDEVGWAALAYQAIRALLDESEATALDQASEHELRAAGLDLGGSDRGDDAGLGSCLGTGK